MQKHFFTRSVSALLLTILVGITSVQAQQRFSAGPRIGVNLSNFAGINGNPKAIAGLTAGAFVMYSSLNHFGISADLMYSQKGAELQAFSVTHRINYLEVPIALRYFLTRNGDFRPNLFVGPAIGFKLNATETNNKTNAKQDISSAINAVDLGLTAGFQLNFNGLGPRQRFLIDGRYTYGLPRTYNLVGASIDRHNSVFTLTLGYGFGIGPEFRSASPARRR